MVLEADVVRNEALETRVDQLEAILEAKVVRNVILETGVDRVEKQWLEYEENVS